MTDVRYGKLPPERLNELLRRVPLRDPRVLIGPRVGEDCAVIDVGSCLLVAKSDPVTFAAERIGWYAVNVNANDVATAAARPSWFLATVLLPASHALAADAILADVVSACEELGVTLCGGHTEITPGIERPIVCGQMLGTVEREHLVTKARARTGDLVLLTRGIAIEGTAIIAREAGERLRALDAGIVKRAARYLDRPGISVVDRRKQYTGFDRRTLDPD